MGQQTLTQTLKNQWILLVGGVLLWNSAFFLGGICAPGALISISLWVSWAIQPVDMIAKVRIGGLWGLGMITPFVIWLGRLSFKHPEMYRVAGISGAIFLALLYAVTHAVATVFLFWLHSWLKKRCNALFHFITISIFVACYFWYLMHASVIPFGRYAGCPFLLPILPFVSCEVVSQSDSVYGLICRDAPYDGYYPSVDYVKKEVMHSLNQISGSDMSKQMILCSPESTFPAPFDHHFIFLQKISEKLDPKIDLFLAGQRNTKEGLVQSVCWIGNGCLQGFFDKKTLLPFAEEDRFVPGQTSIQFADCLDGKRVIPILCFDFFHHGDVILYQMKDDQVALVLVNDAWFDCFMQQQMIRYVRFLSWVYDRKIVYVSPLIGVIHI